MTKVRPGHPPAPARRRARDSVFAAAAELFGEHGIRAVGVEAIAQRAGVAKISLYRSFASKDDLMVEYLGHRSDAYWRWWDDMALRHADNPRAQLGALLEGLGQRRTEPGYRGCPFLHCAIEFSDPSHRGRQMAIGVKQEVRRRLVRLSKALGAANPTQLASGLLLLIDGAYATSQTLGGQRGPGKALGWAADALIEAQLERVRRPHATGPRPSGRHPAPSLNRIQASPGSKGCAAAAATSSASATGRRLTKGQSFL